MRRLRLAVLQHRQLEVETDVHLAAVIVNRVLPELFGDREEEIFRQILNDETRVRLRSAVGPATRRVLEGADLAVRLRRARAPHIARLRAGLDRSTPMMVLPELFSRAQGIRATHMVADAIADEL